jgi:hypothetical protein
MRLWGLGPASAAGSPACGAALGSGALPGPVRARLRARPRGDEPCSGYVYDPAVAHTRARELRAVLPEWARLLYALKANGYRPVVGCTGRTGRRRRLRGRLGRRGRPRPGHPARRAARRGGARQAPGAAAPPARRPRRRRARGERAGAAAAVRGRRRAGRDRAGGAAGQPRPCRRRGHPRHGRAARPFGVSEAHVPAVLDLAASLPGIDVVGFHLCKVDESDETSGRMSFFRSCGLHPVTPGQEDDVMAGPLDKVIEACSQPWKSAWPAG